MLATGTRQPHPVVAAARALAPQIRAVSAEIERERRVPGPIIQAMKDAGIFRISAPRAVGGLELDPLTQTEVIEALSSADASAGWVAAIGSDGGYWASCLEPAVARELYRDVDVITAGAGRPSGRAVVVPGGFRVSGRWAFGSGIQDATWAVVNCIVYDGETPRRTETGAPETRFCYLPGPSCTVVDTWTTTGLRGSGSHDHAVTDEFVPAERTFNRVRPKIPGPLYAFPYMLLANQVGVPLGVARAAIDALVELAESKPSQPAGTLRDEPYVQLAVARAEAKLGGARGYVWQAVGELWETLVAGEPLSPRQRAQFLLAMTAGCAACVEVVDLMYRAGGGSSLYATNPLDRYLRDAHTMQQHVEFSEKGFQAAGRTFLGLESGSVFI